VSRGLAWSGGAALALVSVGLAAKVAAPLYRAEGLRAEARLAIDRYARTPEGDLKALVQAARSSLLRAVRIDPDNAQAWADLAYATSLAVEPQQRAAAGHAAELAADRALALCPNKAEYWVRKGVALDLQLGRPEAEACYRKATELAPRSALWWYYYAFYLQAFPERIREAQEALATCLALDPHYPPAERLRQRISTLR
jgi:tetratricopeptide (TPR) repeat protein